MHFKKIYVTIVKSGFWKSGCHGIQAHPDMSPPPPPPPVYKPFYCISVFLLRFFLNSRISRFYRCFWNKLSVYGDAQSMY